MQSNILEVANALVSQHCQIRLLGYNCQVLDYRVFQDNAVLALVKLQCYEPFWVQFSMLEFL